MNQIPWGLAKLAGVAAFCGGTLLGLLMDVEPVTALWRGACCAASFSLLVWLSARVALSVLRAGVRQDGDDT